MSTPAERYAAAKQRQRESGTKFNAFRDAYEFALDEFQVRACRALESGKGVLVAAPTGSGKTVVGEFAVHLALANGSRAFYTTPIKALSNQKYRDLCEMFGSSNVGLLTGDAVVNGDASVIVMTTEVLRNMIYEESRALSSLTHVVMDEVHYLADRQRGAVWEEVILQLDQSVLVTALSATVSNAEEFGSWLSDVRGATEVVVEERRPVPLHQHVLAGRSLMNLFADEPEGAKRKVNPALLRMAQDDDRGHRYQGRGHGRDRGRSRGRSHDRFVSRPTMIDQLASQGLLPAIVFIFSRRGCDDALQQTVRAGVSLTTPDQREQIAAFIDEYCAVLPAEDLAVLGFHEWRDALARGVASHHAGLLPLFKEVVEHLFSSGLVKVVYATETLALGINMPARTVVLERLVKWNGTAHVDVTAGEYTQLTGRAGRRGIDHEGHAVTIWQGGLDPAALAGLASRRTYPLRSSFRPSYNMAVNLIGQMGQDNARSMLETSFAQFQADAGVVGLANQIRRHEQALAGYQESMTCHLGDFSEYAELRSRLTAAEKSSARDSQVTRKNEIASQLRALQVGDVIALSAGRRVQPALVVEAAWAGDDEPRPRILTLDRRAKKISASEVTYEIEVITRMKLPRHFDSRSANSRRDAARMLQEQTKALSLAKPHRPKVQSDPDAHIAALRAELRRHPCHGCNDREAHARWGQRYYKLKRETDGLRQRMSTATGSIAKQFDRVCDVLVKLHYLQRGDAGLYVTPSGELLAGLYAEQDLLAAECIRNEIWGALTPAELAGAAAALVFESRSADDGGVTPELPGSSALRTALYDQIELAAELAQVESTMKVAFVREPNPGFSAAAWRWCSGDSLGEVLADSELAVGDFVRWSRQLVDLLNQVALTALTPELRGTAQQAVDQLQRGVVSYSASTRGPVAEPTTDGVD